MLPSMINASFVSNLGKIPLVSTLLRKIANRFPEGSIVRIRRGVAAGMLWKRYKRYVNGYWLGIYELPLQQRIALELKAGDTFFDIGANAGFFSLVAAKIVGKTGRVIAFEPLPMNARVVEKQFDINQLDYCGCVCTAISKEQGTCEFVWSRSAKGEPATSTAHLAGYRIDGMEELIIDRCVVKVTSLDDFVTREGLFPDLIKIDVEGAEGDVLRGGRKLLYSNKAPRILMETHGEEIATDVDRQLREAGYRFFTVNGVPLADGLTERHYIAYPPLLDKAPLKTT